MADKGNLSDTNYYENFTPIYDLISGIIKKRRRREPSRPDHTNPDPILPPPDYTGVGILAEGGPSSGARPGLNPNPTNNQPETEVLAPPLAVGKKPPTRFSVPGSPGLGATATGFANVATTGGADSGSGLGGQNVATNRSVPNKGNEILVSFGGGQGVHVSVGADGITPYNKAENRPYSMTESIDGSGVTRAMLEHGEAMPELTADTFKDLNINESRRERITDEHAAINTVLNSTATKAIQTQGPEAVISNFQRQNGLKVSGELDKNTQEKLIGVAKKANEVRNEIHDFRVLN